MQHVDYTYSEDEMNYFERASVVKGTKPIPQMSSTDKLDLLSECVLQINIAEKSNSGTKGSQYSII